jgi:hypothetical protein
LSFDIVPNRAGINYIGKGVGYYIIIVLNTIGVKLNIGWQLTAKTAAIWTGVIYSQTGGYSIKTSRLVQSDLLKNISITNIKIFGRGKWCIKN